LYGGSGNDLLFGDARDNLLGAAVGGEDVLRGRAGNDELFGDAPKLHASSRGGADDLYGGTGDDRLWGDGALTGSAVGGEDRFHFGGSFGDDRILDFRHGEDTIDFTDLFQADLKIAVVGPNTVISSIAGDSVTILGYTGSLAGDIVFS
jgi:Ca2+-binding RTX toxin-like protein